MAGSNDDINVLNHSPLFDSLKKDRVAPSPFEVNGHVYPFGYYLADGTFAIIKTPARVMSVNKMRRIMYSCIVMHNMIQEDNGFVLSIWEQEWLDKPENRPRCNIRRRVKDRKSREKEIPNRNVHDQLRKDLTAHI
ncbi:uncharacterized protein [Rutidosis leptorrhynchoides]|uniref:uncharacterized protein n=1 Tax=Rutidosis leptorrhynchoides TaxID=125765 RepID=UPI003A99985A